MISSNPLTLNWFDLMCALCKFIWCSFINSSDHKKVRKFLLCAAAARCLCHFYFHAHRWHNFSRSRKLCGLGWLGLNPPLEGDLQKGKPRRASMHLPFTLQPILIVTHLNLCQALEAIIRLPSFPPNPPCQQPSALPRAGARLSVSVCVCVCVCVNWTVRRA